MRRTAVVVLLLSIFFLPRYRSKRVEPQFLDKSYLIARCDALAEMAEPRLGGDFLLTDFIEQLGDQKQFDALRFLATSDVPGSATAASVYVQKAGCSDALRFIPQIKRGNEWRSAVWSLSFYPKPEIIGFFRSLADTPYANCHAECYEIGSERDWNDFVELAWTDAEKSDRIFHPVFDTIGQIARDYLRKFEKTRPIPDEPWVPGMEE